MKTCQAACCEWIPTRRADLDALEQLGYIARHINEDVPLWPSDQVAGTAERQLAVEPTVEDIGQAWDITREALLCELLQVLVFVSDMNGVPA